MAFINNMQPELQLIDNGSVALFAKETAHTFPGLKEHLVRLKNPCQIYTFDVDHSLQDTKPLIERGELSPAKYLKYGYKADLENFDLVTILVVLRKGVHLCTGKGANFWPLADYLKERVRFWETTLDFMDNLKLDESFPVTGVKDIPPLLVATSGNGGVSLDVIENKGIVYKPIPLSGWEGMQKWAELLRQSSRKSRMEQITRILSPRIPYDQSADKFLEVQRITDQNHRDKYNPPHDLNPILNEVDLFREIAPQLSDEEQAHRLLLGADIRDHVLFIESEWAKANYVFDFDRIINNKNLNNQWIKATGIKITDLKSFMNAFKIISQDWGVESFFAVAQGTTFVDIVAKGINKGLSSRLIKNYYQGKLRLSLAKITGQNPAAVKLPKISSLALVDNNEDYSNDAALRVKNSGSVVVGHHPTRKKNKNGETFYPEDVYGGNLRNPEMTNLYLKDVVRIICPQFAEQIIRQVEKEYTGEVN